MSSLYLTLHSAFRQVSIQLNKLYLKFIKRNPGYDGKVKLIYYYRFIFLFLMLLTYFYGLWGCRFPYMVIHWEVFFRMTFYVIKRLWPLHFQWSGYIKIRLNTKAVHQLTWSHLLAATCPRIQEDRISTRLFLLLKRTSQGYNRNLHFLKCVLKNQTF